MDNIGCRLGGEPVTGGQRQREIFCFFVSSEYLDHTSALILLNEYFQSVKIINS